MKKLVDWDGNSKSVFSTIGASNHSLREREYLDFYASPSSIVEDLLKYHIIPHRDIWECAAGENNLVFPLQKAGYKVITSDIIERKIKLDYVEDFLSTTQLRAPIILTNPPYNKAKEFIIHSIELGAEYIYMFLKTTFLEGQSRYNELFSKYPPKEIWVFTKRVQVALNNNEEEFKKSSAVSYSWFIWEKGYKGAPMIYWI